VKRLLALASACVLVAGCGSGDDLSGELAGAVAVVSAPADAVAIVGRDVAGNVGSQDAEARLEILEVEPGAARVLEPYGEVPDLADPIRVVRDPLGRGGAGAVLPTGDRVLIVVSTLLDPTRQGIRFGGRLVALRDGGVVAADWSEAAVGRLGALLDGTSDPAGVLAETVRALADEGLGRALTPRQQELVDVVSG
jgi:hypothetical protein